MSKAIGLIVNPVAGMGGSVGLKGTDGTMYREAVKLGAEPVTPGRTRDFLAHLTRKDELTLLVAPGRMGARYAEGFDVLYTVIGEIGQETTAEDTQRIAREMLEHGIDLLIFVGGDGTARDIQDAIGSKVPVVAVPAGVKVFSSAFAVSPRGAAEMVDAVDVERGQSQLDAEETAVVDEPADEPAVDEPPVDEPTEEEQAVIDQEADDLIATEDYLNEDGGAA